MWIKAIVLKETKGFVTYLDENNKDVFIQFPKLKKGRIIPLPFHIFNLLHEKGVVDYYKEKYNSEKKQESIREQKYKYRGLAL